MTALFTLEALEAEYGDCLLLHYGTTQDPKTVLIDGGPPTIYRKRLRARLLSLRQRLVQLGTIGNSDQLPLSLIMASHIDDDHIGGLLELTDDPDGGLSLPGKAHWVRPLAGLWHNTLDDVLGDDAKRLVVDAHNAPTLAAVVAGVPKARDLQANAGRLGWPLNKGFTGLVEAPPKGGLELPLDEHTRICVLGPRENEIESFRKKWKSDAGKLKPKTSSPAEIAALTDDSAYNLSSIVCLVRQGEHSMLLTGDCRGDLVVDGLAAAGLLPGHGIDVDIFKVPHHGSDRNINESVLKTIRAKHYVISANGR